MRVSKTADMSARPAGAMHRRLPGAVQDGGDYVVRQLPREYANQVDDAGVGRPSSLADFVLLDLHLCVIAALPMDDKGQGLTDDIDDDFFDEQPDVRIPTMPSGHTELEASTCSDLMPSTVLR
jgi:hypothetical protein